ncbi:MAG: Gfo/Idh/MocA family oxidoreductase [Chloroflexi bacterium]|nr:Gfo/Idh/MocA family oxidoreductase [Chloroflexota bacterium]
MADQTVRIGHIGAGRWSKNVILPALQQIPGVELVTVANSSAESSAAVAQQSGFARTAADWREVIEASDVDAVILGTRTELHAGVVEAVLGSGKHLLMMNAIARTAEEAASMVEASTAAPRQVALVYPAVFGPFYVKEDAAMTAILESGVVGEVLHVRTSWQTPFFGLGSMFEPCHRWFGEHARVLGWRKQYDAPPTTTPEGRELRPQMNLALAELHSGATISYEHSTIAGGAQARVEVHGTDGTLLAYAGGQDVGGFFRASKDGKQLQPIALPDDLEASLGTPLAVEAEFIAAVRGARPAAAAIPRFVEGLHMLQFTEAWSASRDSRAWRDLPDA